jgi:hypothetical protein
VKLAVEEHDSLALLRLEAPLHAKPCATAAHRDGPGFRNRGRLDEAGSVFPLRPVAARLVSYSWRNCAI